VTVLQTGGLHMPVRVVYDAGDDDAHKEQRESATATTTATVDPQRLRVELYNGQDVTVTSAGIIYNSYPRVNATACDQMAEPAGPTANAASSSLPSLAPLPPIQRPHWHYAGRALVPRLSSSSSTTMREAHVWLNTTRHTTTLSPGSTASKTSSYYFYVDAQSGRPLRFYMVGFNILAGSHYDEYLLDFESFEARDFSKGEERGEEGVEDPFAIPAACPRVPPSSQRQTNSRSATAVVLQAAAAMPWSAVAVAKAADGGATLLSSSAASSPTLAAQRAAALTSAQRYIRDWNARRDQELQQQQALHASSSASNAPSSLPTMVRPLLRENHLALLTDEEFAATMTAAAGGVEARRARRARALLTGEDEDELVRQEGGALSPDLEKYHLGTLVPSYELEHEEDEEGNGEEEEEKQQQLGRSLRLILNGDAASAESSNKHKKHRRPLPREVDWRGTAADPGAPTDQGTCGSCWAFAAAGAMSGAWAVATGQVRPLSQQQMVDCAWRTANNGCGGGWIERAIAYVADSEVSGGAVSGESYPYTNVNSWCGDRDAWPLNRGRTPAVGGFGGGGGGGGDSSPPPGVARFRGFAAVRPHDDEALMDAVAHHGPVAVSIDASPMSFKFSGGGGVYYSDECGWKPRDLDHAVLVVGYGTDPNTKADYWTIKNSWSSLWGDNGYIRVKRGFGSDCGITTSPFMPVVDEAAARRVADRTPLVPRWKAPVVVKADD
jgi:cathepsin L